jgi:hypothetical protein
MSELTPFGNKRRSALEYCGELVIEESFAAGSNKRTPRD